MQVTEVWKQVDPGLAEELLAFWQRSGAIADAGQAAMRAEQAVCVGRDQTGALCAVGTAILQTPPRLRQPVYYYRQFFDASQRGKGLAVDFANRSKAVLEAYNASLDAPESLGMLVEVESRMLASRYKLALEPDTGYAFIGYSPRGMVLRVSYFGNATLGPPAPAGRRGRVAAAARH
jgi:hypothetical protein